jgi:glycine hydroxymethyltransferase
MRDVVSLVDRHEAWRLGKCLNLQASENLVSPQVKRILGSDLAGRYTMPWGKEWYGEFVENHYRGTRFLDEIEAWGEDLARDLFHAPYATLRPLSGHIAGMMCLLATCRRGDRILVVRGEDGGYDGYLPPNIPSVLGLDLDVDFLPFDEGKWNLDHDACAEAILRTRPRLVLVGASYLLFPYNLRWLRGVCDDVAAVLAYDGSHVMGLIAGGRFQRPLVEGADILVGSTHKSLFGPQGGLFLTNRKDLYERAMAHTTWKLFDNAHWNRIGAVAQALLEAKAFGPAYAAQVVENAQVLARQLDGWGFPVLFRDLGYTKSHQIHIDTDRLRSEWDTSPPALAERLEGNNIIVDSGGRIGAAEITRAGATPDHMQRVAELLVRGAKGEDVAGEVAALREELTIGYVFPAE